MIGFDDTMPIGAMTKGDLKLLMHEILETAAGQNATKRTTSSAKRYVYGIKGIEELFGCSHATAQHYKDHVIKEAVTHNVVKTQPHISLSSTSTSQKVALSPSP